MWALILSGLLVGATVSASNPNAWNKGLTYEYEIEAKALTALHEVQNQFAGIQIVGKLLAQLVNASTLAVQLQNMQVAEIHRNLSGGWASEIPEDQLQLKPLPLETNQFNLKYSNGVITNITFSKKADEPEMNLLKGLASVIQLDLQSGISKSLGDSIPNSGVYSTMEAIVTGKCLTKYVYGPYAKYAALADEDLDVENWRADKNLYTVKKSVNFTECDKRIGYHYGVNSLTYWEPVENSLGKTYSRSSNTEAVISGSPQNFTIQKAIVTNQVTLNPLLYIQQKGMLGSQVKIVLKSVSPISKPLPEIKDPVIAEDLVYTYPNISKLVPSLNSRRSVQPDSNEDSGSSSDDSDSLPEEYSTKKRYRRVASYESEAGSSSDEEQDNDQFVPSPDVLHAPYLPFYEHLLLHPRPDISVYIYKLVVKIATELREPNTIPSNETLASFQILSKRLMLYDVGDLIMAANKFYAPYPVDPHSESQAQRYQQWVVYINALAESGSGPSLKAINELIKLNKLQGQLAANAIGKLPRAALFPNQDYVSEFYRLVINTENKSPENASAALSFGNVLRLSAVDRQSLHNRYPVHIYGELSAASRPQIIRYIAYFGGRLAQAVKNADSVSVQVYTRALGNIGHPQVVKVLLPYLTGQKTVSNFQRLLMVLALDQVAHLSPERVSPLLIQIYQSLGETHQIRSAAVLILMATNPTSTVLKRIAQFSNQDPNPHVVSVVKTAIESAAKLTTPQNEKLANSAKAAADMLNPNKTAAQYSAKHLQDYIVRGMALSYYQKMSQIGSRDTLIPNGLYSSLQLNIGGLKHLSGEAQAAISSVKDAKYLLQNIIVESGEKSGKQRKSPAIEKIITDLREQIEGQIATNILSHPSILPFDNRTIIDWIEAIRSNVSNLEKGVSFNETQLVRSVDLRLGFPNAFGLSSYIDYQSPALYSIGGQLRIKTSPRLNSVPHGHLASPRIVNASADIQIVYSRRTSGAIGFHLPALGKNYAAGLVKNYQIQVPIRISIDLDRPNNATYVRLQPIDQEYRYQLAHSSSAPYTRIFRTAIAVPLISEEGTKIIHIRNPRSWRASYGKNVTGMVFSVDYRSEKEFDDAYSVYERLLKHDALSGVLFSHYEYEIYPSNISLYYEPAQSISKAVELSASYDEIPISSGKSPRQPQPEDSESENSESESGDEESEEDGIRRKRYIPLKQLSESAYQNSVLKSGKIDYDSDLQDVARSLYAPGRNYTIREYRAAVKFVNQRGASWKLVLLTLSSLVNRNSELLGFSELSLPLAKQPYRACINAQGDVPNVPFMNLDKALKSNPNSSVGFRLSAGQGDCESGMNVYGQLILGRSHSWLQNVQQSEITAVCRSQMKRLNNVLPACRNATIDAATLNNYELALKYRNVPYQVSNATFALYSALKQANYLYISENPVNASARPGLLRANLLVAPDLRSLNVSLSVEKLDAKLENVRISKAVGKLLISHPLIPRPERLANYLTNWKYNASCSVDISSIKTFDNRTYLYKPNSNCWKVLLTTAREHEWQASPLVKSPNVTVMARRVNPTQREVKILVGDNEIAVVYRGGNYVLKVNKQHEIISQKYVTVMNGYRGQPLVVAYGLPDSVRVETSGVIVYFDQQRVLLQADDSFRRQVRGLCGTFDGQPITDFKVPANCIVRNVTEFIEAYTSSEGCSPVARSYGRPQNCYKEQIIPGNHTVEPRADPTCIVYHHRVVIRSPEVCISRKPLPSCKLQCDPIDQVNKVAPFRCYDLHADGVQQLVAQVKRGGSVDFNGVDIEGRNVNIEVSISTACERSQSLSEEED